VTDVDGTIVSYQLVADVAEGSLTFNADGSYSFNPGTDFDDLADGTSRDVTFTYTATDNNNAVSAEKIITITVTGSNDIATISGGDTGAVSEDISVDGDGNITDSGTLTITDPDNGEASFNVGTITGIYGSLNIDASGNWSYAADNSQSVIQDLLEYQTLTDTFTVHSVDLTPHNVVVTINGTEDIPPTVDSVIMSDSGTPLKIGDVRTVTVTFSEAVNFSNANIIADNGILGTFTPDATEKVWTATFTPTNGIEDDANIVTVSDTYTDKFENVGSGAVSANYEIDTIAPDVAVTGITDDTAGASISDFKTSDDLLIINGTYAAYDTSSLTVEIDDGASYSATFTLASTELNTSGDTWQLDLTSGSPLSEGDYTLIVTAEDAAGNTNSNSTIITVDQTPPAVAVTGVTDNSGVAGDFITNDNAMIISGTFEAGDTDVLKVTFNGSPYTVGDSFLTTAGSTWQLNLDGQPGLSDNDYTVEVTVTDVAGNSDTISQVITIDTSKPTGQTIDRVADDVNPVISDVVNGGYTNDDTPTLHGNAEAGSTVTIYDGGALVTTLPAGTGNWSYTPAALADGSIHTYKITATDAAGNTSADSADFVLHIDTSISAPQVTVNIDPATENTVVTYPYSVGSIEATGVAHYTLNSVDWATVMPTVSAAGDYQLAVWQVDAAGNISGSTLLEFAYGSLGDDALDTATRNIVIGRDGVDAITGAGGDDFLYGDAGDDILTGGGGTNYLYGGSDSDKFIGGSGTDSFDGGVDGQVDSDTVSYENDGAGVSASLATNSGTGGVADGDVYAAIENLIGGGGKDILEGNLYDNILSGAGGDDLFLGSSGADTYYGNTDSVPGSDLDTVSYASFSAAINASLTDGTGGDGSFTDSYQDIENLTGGSGADNLYGAGNNNILTGGDGSDHLYGLGGNDTLYGGFAGGVNDGSHDYLYGGDGNDTLQGGSGADDFYGGAGSDTVSYAGTGAPLFISLAGNFRFGGAVGDFYDSIENLTGSENDDWLQGDGGPNTLKGGGGNDTLDGGAGNDVIWADQGTDKVDGYGDNDTIHVSSTDLPDYVNGGDGIDTVEVHGLGANPYDLTNLASKLSWVEKLDISDGVGSAGVGTGTEMTISTQDIQNMVDNGNSSELTIMADSGDSLVLAAGDSFVGPVFDPVSPAGDYNISDGGGLSATIHWVIA
jgi:VCBS repeat-containing protein